VASTFEIRENRKVPLHRFRRTRRFQSRIPRVRLDYQRGVTVVEDGMTLIGENQGPEVPTNSSLEIRTTTEGDSTLPSLRSVIRESLSKQGSSPASRFRRAAPTKIVRVNPVRMRRGKQNNDYWLSTIERTAPPKAGAGCRSEAYRHFT
jgi:hypothetical protein